MQNDFVLFIIFDTHTYPTLNSTCVCVQGILWLFVSTFPSPYKLLEAKSLVDNIEPEAVGNLLLSC